MDSSVDSSMDCNVDCNVECNVYWMGRAVCRNPDQWTIVPDWRRKIKQNVENKNSRRGVEE